MSLSPVLFIVAFYRGNPMLTQCQGIGVIFKYQEHQTIKLIYKGTIDMQS